MNYTLRLLRMFKEDYQAARLAIRDPTRFDKELKTIAGMLRHNPILSPRYVSNRLLVDGVGWHQCYVYVDKKTTIIMQYKVEEHMITLARIGTPETLAEKRPSL